MATAEDVVRQRGDTCGASEARAVYALLGTLVADRYAVKDPRAGSCSPQRQELLEAALTASHGDEQLCRRCEYRDDFCLDLLVTARKALFAGDGVTERRGRRRAP